MPTKKPFPRIQNYQYRCTDDSCLLKWFKAYGNIYYPLIPKSWTANQITIVSCMLVVLALWVSFFQWFGSGSAWVVAVLIHFYVVGDHLDGMRAKQTQSSSALGEFTDHFLDLFNTGMITASVLNFVPLSQGVYFAIICLALAAYVATFVEQLEKDWLHFRLLGSLEGDILLIAFLVSFGSMQQFWLRPWFFGLEGYFSLVLLATVGSLVTVLTIFWSLPKPSWPLVHYLIISSWLAFLASRSYVFVGLGLLCLCLYAAHYVAQLFLSYFTEAKHKHPNVGFSLVVAASFFTSLWQPGKTEIIFYVLVGLSLLVAAGSIIKILRVLRQPLQPS